MKKIKVYLYHRDQKIVRIGKVWNENQWHRESFFIKNLKKSFNCDDFSQDFSVNLSEEDFNNSLDGISFEVGEGLNRILLTVCDKREGR